MLFLRNYFGDIRTFLYIIEVLNYKDIRSVLELGTYNIQSLREILLRTEDPQMINVKGVFYYDETNNGRKFWLKRKDGFNSSEMENFILGGVMHYNDKSSADIDKLFRDLSIQKTATEVKLKHLASGDFWNV